MRRLVETEVLEPRRLFATISGVIYHDANKNDQPDPGEGLAGCVVTFNNNADHTVRTPVTAEDGTFSTQIEPGDYKVNVDGPGVAHALNVEHLNVIDGDNFFNARLATEGGGGHSPTPPDLAVTISPLPASLTSTSKPAVVTVANKGGAYSGPITVTVYFSTDKVIDDGDTHLPSVTLPAVSIAAKKTHVFPVDLAPLSATLPGGSYFMLAKLTGTTDDSNSANDTGVSKKAAKVITPSVNLTGTVKLGKLSKTKALPVTLTLKNTGTVTASGPVTVSLAARPVAGGSDIALTSPGATTLSIKSKKTSPLKATLDLSSLPAGSYRLVVTFNMTSTPSDSSTEDNTILSTPFTIK